MGKLGRPCGCKRQETTPDVIREDVMGTPSVHYDDGAVALEWHSVAILVIGTHSDFRAQRLENAK